MTSYSALPFIGNWGMVCKKLEDNLTIASTGTKFMRLSQNQELYISFFLSVTYHICADTRRASQFLNNHANVGASQEHNFNTENSSEAGEVLKHPPMSHFLSVDDEVVIQYSKDCNEAVKIILAFIHLTVGTTASATETELYQLLKS